MTVKKPKDPAKTPAKTVLKSARRVPGQAKAHVAEDGGRLARRLYEVASVQAQGYARSHPGIFLAGAALAGFALARIVRPSAGKRTEPQS